MYLTVQGIPKAQPRVKARAFKVGNVCRVSMYTPDGAKEWKTAIVEACKVQMAEGDFIGKGKSIGITVEFRMPRPKSHFGSRKGVAYLKDSAPAFHTGKPDIDNLLKAVFDALNELLWHDDSQITAVAADKVYGVEPGMTIWIAEGV